VLARRRLIFLAAAGREQAMRALDARLAADSAVGAAGRASVPPALPATGPGSDYAQLSRTVKRAGLLRRRPVYYSFKIGLNLVLLAAGWTAFAVLGQSRLCRGRACVTPRRPCGRSAPSAAFPYSETGVLASYAQVLRHLHTTGRAAGPEPAADAAVRPDATPEPWHRMRLLAARA
jgi:hypothetical protein